MGSYPTYIHRTNIIMQWDGFGAEALTDMRFLMNFNRFPEATIRCSFSCTYVNSPGSSLNIRVGGNIDTVDGTVVASGSLTLYPTGFPPGQPNDLVLTFPNVFSGILPFKVTGESLNGQVAAVQVMSFFLYGV